MLNAFKRKMCKSICLFGKECKEPRESTMQHGKHKTAVNHEQKEVERMTAYLVWSNYYNFKKSQRQSNAITSFQWESSFDCDTDFLCQFKQTFVSSYRLTYSVIYRSKRTRCQHNHHRIDTWNFQPYWYTSRADCILYLNIHRHLCNTTITYVCRTDRTFGWFLSAFRCCCKSAVCPVCERHIAKWVLSPKSASKLTEDIVLHADGSC